MKKKIIEFVKSLDINTDCNYSGKLKTMFINKKNKFGFEENNFEIIEQIKNKFKNNLPFKLV